MDIGGTLSKIVYFERRVASEPPSPKKQLVDFLSMSSLRRTHSFNEIDSPAHREALDEIYNLMSDPKVLGRTGVRDEHLSFYSHILGGRLHFIRFQSRRMDAMIDMLSGTEITRNIHTIGCTGGGAHKYAKRFADDLGIEVQQQDELRSLMIGMHFVMMNNVGECYTYRYDEDLHSQAQWKRDVKDFVHKVPIPYSHLFADSIFPYLVVNVGSGVSILKVSSPGKFERVSGTSIGGGTYWGLCRLITRCKSFEEVLEKAEMGDAECVDMLVRDIYGGDYGNMKLQGSMVASSFGKLVIKDNPRESLREEDLAIALLMMITNNIGQVAYLNAQLHKCSKIYFVGNFLRHNSISSRRLAFAIDFWSKGSMEALFLEHEGYFGALGTFLMSVYGDEVDKMLSSSSSPRKERVLPSQLPVTPSGSSASNNISRMMRSPKLENYRKRTNSFTEEPRHPCSSSHDSASASASVTPNRRRTQSLDYRSTGGGFTTESGDASCVSATVSTPPRTSTIPFSTVSAEMPQMSESSEETR